MEKMLDEKHTTRKGRPKELRLYREYLSLHDFNCPHGCISVLFVPPVVDVCAIVMFKDAVQSTELPINDWVFIDQNIRESAPTCPP